MRTQRLGKFQFSIASVDLVHSCVLNKLYIGFPLPADVEVSIYKSLRNLQKLDRQLGVADLLSALRWAFIDGTLPILKNWIGVEHHSVAIAGLIGYET